MNRPITTALGWRLPSWLLDYGPVAVIVFEGGAAIALKGGDGKRAAILVVGLAVIAVALVLRHRRPLGVLLVLLALSLGLNFGPIVTLPVLLGLFTVAEYADRRQTILAAVAVATAMLATPALHGVSETPPALLSRLIAIGLALAVGLYLRTRAEYINGLRERAERLERERELLAQQAVADERVRIARELHDVVAHNVSLMVVQAQALQATGGGPEEGVTLGRVADLGREALSEMHRMLDVLRVDHGAAEREPQPGVRDLDTLITRTRATGLDARLIVTGEPRELAPGIDLSAYRIIQEALTNVVRHARASRAVVRLAYAQRAVELTVDDDGIGPQPAPGGTRNGHGHGLVGMRERVALFGGEFEAAAGPDGTGYRVRALLPVS